MTEDADDAKLPVAADVAHEGARVPLRTGDMGVEESAPRTRRRTGWSRRRRRRLAGCSRGMRRRPPLAEVATDFGRRLDKGRECQRRPALGMPCDPEPAGRRLGLDGDHSNVWIVLV